MSERANTINRMLDRFPGIPLVLLTAMLRKLPHKFQNPPKSICILCLGAIGDLLLLSALTGSLRLWLDSHGMQKTQICMLTTSANTGAVPLIPGIDEHVSFPVRHVLAMLRFLRSRHFDLLIDTSQWARIGALLCNLSGAGRTIGFATHGQYRAAGYDFSVMHRSDQHEYLNFLALGQAVFPLPSTQPQLLIPEILPAAYADLQKFTGSEWIYLHLWPSGMLSFMKEWPEKYWAELARELLARGLHVCLTGSSQDVPRTQAFLQEYFPAEQHIISLAGKDRLPVLAWLLVRARAAVCVNTGIMHLAALCGTPTVALHGGINPLRWGPVGKATISLLPRSGACAYLNLGFEYPKGVESSLPFLPVADVLAALGKLGVL